MRHYARIYRGLPLEPTRFMGDFWSKVKRGDPHECWPWLGFRKSSGHGLTSHRNQPIHTSRKAWILTYGEIREDWACVNHKCDNAICCNPEHMYLGTRSDNAIDQWDKTPPEKRGLRGRNYAMNDETMKKLLSLRKKGLNYKECAKELGVHHVTVSRTLRLYYAGKLNKIRADRLANAQK